MREGQPRHRLRMMPSHTYEICKQQLTRWVLTSGSGQVHVVRAGDLPLQLHLVHDPQQSLHQVSATDLSF
eukprot:3756611-Rhodomonas_salina.1